MQQLSFIHVSDLHLDNFPPVKPENDEMAMRLHEAPYEALKNLLELCRQKSPQFIVFSGDIHEHGVLSLKARFSLMKFFNALKALNIPFYYACGNHDHLGQNDKFFQNFDLVFRFTETWTTFSFVPQENSVENTPERTDENFSEHMDDMPEEELSEETERETDIELKEYLDDAKNEAQDAADENADEELGENSGEELVKTEIPFCHIHGISHTNRKELKNLLKDFVYEKKAFFNIGVLHASVHNSESVKNTDKHVVALCREKDFAPFPLDYWALGHIHELSIVHQDPFVAYSGAMQATRMNENGAHGAYFVTIEKNEKNPRKGPKIHTEFCPLAPLETYVLNLELPAAETEELENIEQCLEYFLYTFKKEYTKFAKNPKCSTRIFTIFLEGQHDLSQELQSEDFIQNLKDKLEELDLGTRIFINKIKSLIRPSFGYENAHKRDDLLGEIFRTLENLRNDPEACKEILKKIENDFKIKNEIDLGFFSHSDKPSQEQVEKYQNALLNACENICVNILEPK